jgi:hypothetical protein
MVTTLLEELGLKATAGVIAIAVAAYGLIGPLPGAWAAAIIVRKGHGAGRAWLHFLFGAIAPALFLIGAGSFSSVGAVVAACLPCVLVLLSAAVATDHSLGEELDSLRYRLSRAPEVAAPGDGEIQCAKCGKNNDLTLESCWFCKAPLIPADADGTNQGDAEQKSGHPDKLRVACRACGRRFEGMKGKILVLRKCPRCGVVPFDYQLLPTKKRLG